MTYTIICIIAAILLVAGHHGSAANRLGPLRAHRRRTVRNSGMPDADQAACMDSMDLAQ